MADRIFLYEGTTNVDRSAAVRHQQEDTSPTPRPPGLSIIVLNYENPSLLRGIIDGFSAVKKSFTDEALGIELLLGDTGSRSAEVAEILRALPEGASVERNLRYNFSRNNNHLFRQSKYDVVLFLNNDVLIADNPRAVRLTYDLHKATARVVSAVLDFPDGKVQHRGVSHMRVFGIFGLPFHPGAGDRSVHDPGEWYPTEAATGAFMMVEADLFARLGGFDESYVAECQDVDLCLKAHRFGVGCAVLDVGPLVHLENATRPKGEENWEDRRLFLRRWSSYIETI